MFSTKVNLQVAGVYVYRSPKQISIPDLQRELIITLMAKNHGVCGLIVYPHGFVRVELFELLTNLKSTLCFEKNIPVKEIEAKIFGCSSGQTNALYATQTWLRDQQIEITAIDTGRDVTRDLLIDCQTSKVGVKFADINPAQESFLKLDSPSQRANRKEQTTHQTALLVTNQRPLGFLAKRALEQNPQWKAERISSKDFLKTAKKALSKNKTTVVICFEDVSEEKNINSAIVNSRQKNPDTVYLWAADNSTELPLPLPCISLPTSMAPEVFLKDLTETLEAPPVESGRVLILPVKHARKNSK